MYKDKELHENLNEINMNCNPFRRSFNVNSEISATCSRQGFLTIRIQETFRVLYFYLKF